MNYLDARLPDRFWSKCVPEPNTGCWLWLAVTNRQGYGRIVMNQRLQLAHRVAYEALVGIVPVGLELDHFTCSTPLCCNPAHLRAVTHTENMRRSTRLVEAGRVRAAKRTHCVNGHEYTEENTWRRPGAPLKRSCKTCERDQLRERRRKLRAA
jgi:hypothetical protein